MNGKLVGVFIVGSAAIAGIAMAVLQLYAFYDEVPEEERDIRLTLWATGEPEVIDASDIQAIDADSSPLRYRACFTTSHSQAMLTETYVTYEKPVPHTAPGWFECFDAEVIGAGIEAEMAIAYLSQADIHDGFDRVVAIFDDGRGFSWHQPNAKYSEQH